jgi:formylglycine-generating enzyme required for sulfatase activity
MKNIILLLLIITISVACTPKKEVDPTNVNMKLSVNLNSWVTVPKGTFISGLNEHLENIAYDYQIMVTEVTYNQYAKYLNKAFRKGLLTVDEGQVFGEYHGDKFHGGRHEKVVKKGKHIYFNLNGERVRITFDGSKFTVKKGYEKFPAAYMTWIGAWGYAKFNGYRLPTNNEWEKATRGPKGNVYLGECT